MMKVLLIDESRTMRTTLSMYSEKYKFELICADNAFEAMQLMKSQAPKLIIADAILPDLTGYQLCYLVKQHPDLQRIPFVVSSSLDNKLEQAKSEIMAADYMLQKPFNEQDITKLMACPITTTTAMEDCAKSKQLIELWLHDVVGKELLNLLGLLGADINLALDTIKAINQVAVVSRLSYCDKLSTFQKKLQDLLETGSKDTQAVETEILNFIYDQETHYQKVTERKVPRELKELSRFLHTEFIRLRHILLNEYNSGKIALQLCLSGLEVAIEGISETAADFIKFLEQHVDDIYQVFDNESYNEKSAILIKKLVGIELFLEHLSRYGIANKQFLPSEESLAILRKSYADAGFGNNSLEKSDSINSIEPEIYQIFQEESHEIIDDSLSKLRILENDLNNKEIIESLRRDMHTIKGCGRMVNLNELADIAYDIESFYDEAKHDTLAIDEHAIKTLISTMNFLKQVLSADADDNSFEQLKKYQSIKSLTAASSAPVKITIEQSFDEDIKRIFTKFEELIVQWYEHCHDEDVAEQFHTQCYKLTSTLLMDNLVVTAKLAKKLLFFIYNLNGQSLSDQNIYIETIISTIDIIKKNIDLELQGNEAVELKTQIARLKEMNIHLVSGEFSSLATQAKKA